jgi:hypothetical protein
MCAYLLRNIPPVLWGQVRARAKTEGHTARAILINLLYRYVRGEF